MATERETYIKELVGGHFGDTSSLRNKMQKFFGRIYDLAKRVEDKEPANTAFYSFKLFAENNSGVIIEDVTGVINNTEKTIKLTVPDGTVVTALKPSWEVNDRCKVTVNNSVETSGTSQFNFTGDVIFKVEETLDDTNSTEYTVSVVIEEEEEEDGD